jgi:hypothetical protein
LLNFGSGGTPGVLGIPPRKMGGRGCLGALPSEIFENKRDLLRHPTLNFKGSHVIAGIENRAHNPTTKIIFILECLFLI